MNRSTPRFIHTPSKEFWIAAAMLDFPDRGGPFKMTSWPGRSSLACASGSGPSELLEILGTVFAGLLSPRRHRVGNFLQNRVVRSRNAVESAQAHDLAIEEVGFD